MLINTGTQERVIAEVTPATGSTVREGSIKSDTLLVTLYVNSITSGTLTVSVVTLTDTGREADIISFPVVSAPTTNLLLKKASISLQRFKITATYTGICDYEIYVRAVAGLGEANAKILGAGSLSTSFATVTTTAAVLVPAALTDRNGITFKNYSGAGTVFISEDIAKLPNSGWPVLPSEVWALDISAGVTLYAVSSSGSNNIRIAESGA